MQISKHAGPEFFFAFLNLILDAKMPNGTSKFNGSGDCRLYLVTIIKSIFVLIGSNIWGITLTLFYPVFLVLIKSPPPKNGW